MLPTIEIIFLKMRIGPSNFAFQIITPKEGGPCKYNFWKATIKS